MLPPYPPKRVSKFCDPCKFHHIHQNGSVNFVTPVNSIASTNKGSVNFVAHTNSTTSIKQGVTVSESQIHVVSPPRDTSTPSTTWAVLGVFRHTNAHDFW